MKYIIEKMLGYNTIGELKNFWRISYFEYDTKYTLPKKFFTKQSAKEELKRLS